MANTIIFPSNCPIEMYHNVFINVLLEYMKDNSGAWVIEFIDSNWYAISDTVKAIIIQKILVKKSTINVDKLKQIINDNIISEIHNLYKSGLLIDNLIDPTYPTNLVKREHVEEIYEIRRSARKISKKTGLYFNTIDANVVDIYPEILVNHGYLDMDISEAFKKKIRDNIAIKTFGLTNITTFPLHRYDKKDHPFVHKLYEIVKTLEQPVPKKTINNPKLEFLNEYDLPELQIDKINSLSEGTELYIMVKHCESIPDTDVRCKVIKDLLNKI